MSKFEFWSLFIACIQGGALVLVLIVYFLQLRTMQRTQEATAGQLVTMREASAGQNLIALTNFIQAEDVREARRVVIELLKDRHFSDWSGDEKRSAAKVCSSYGTAGIMLETK